MIGLTYFCYFGSFCTTLIAGNLLVVNYTVKLLEPFLEILLQFLKLTLKFNRLLKKTHYQSYFKMNYSLVLLVSFVPTRFLGGVRVLV